MNAKIRVLEDRLFVGELHYIQAAGPSSVSKPTTGIVTGSIFLESDTGKVYIFDETSAAWTEM